MPPIQRVPESGFKPKLSATFGVCLWLSPDRIPSPFTCPWPPEKSPEPITHQAGALVRYAQSRISTSHYLPCSLEYIKRLILIDIQKSMRNLSANWEAIRTTMSHHLSVPEGAAMVARPSATSHSLSLSGTITQRARPAKLASSSCLSLLVPCGLPSPIAGLAWGQGAEETHLPSDSC